MALPVQKIVAALRLRAALWPKSHLNRDVELLLANFEHIPHHKQVDIVATHIKRMLKNELDAMASLIERGDEII